MERKPDNGAVVEPLRANNLTVAYGAGVRQTTVLLDVSLVLTPGTITGLAGESGSGKSTLALSLMGYRPGGQATLHGQVELDGDVLTGASIRHLREVWGSRLAYMPQDTSTSLNPALTIGTHFSEILKEHMGLRGRAAEQRAAHWLSRVDVPDPESALRRYPHQFSGGQQQRIALALALCLEPEVLILDEPTTGLDVVTQAQVNRLIVALAKDAEVATLYVSHNLALLATVCDDLAIMYAGQIIESGPVAEVYHSPRHPYTSALISAVPSVTSDSAPRGIPGLARTSAPNGECGFLARCRLRIDDCASAIPLISVGERHLARCIRPGDVPPPATATSATSSGQDRPTGRQDSPEGSATILAAREVTCVFTRKGRPPFTAVDSVSFEVPAGRTLGIAGESGSGKSTLLKAIAGLVRPHSGSIAFRGTELPALAAERSATARKGVQIVFQNPDATLNPRHTIAQSLERPVKLFWPHTGSRDRQAMIADMMHQVHLSPVLLTRFPRDLSGGQRQRVAIARSLLAQPDVLLCDEVTSALDVSVQASIIELLVGLREERNLAMVFVTHDLGVLRSIADEAIIMQDGQARERGSVAQILDHPSDPYTIRLIEAVPRPSAGSTNGRKE